MPPILASPALRHRDTDIGALQGVEPRRRPSAEARICSEIVFVHPAG